MAKKAIRIGLMGCGIVADYGHVPAIQQTDGLNLRALYNPSAAAAEILRRKYGIPEAYTDSTTFFRSGIEAVSIASPAPCHLDNVLEAAAHGLPVLCEKPLAMDCTEADRMITAMRTAGLPLYTAFVYRFSPAALKIRELIAAGAIGQARVLRLIYNWSCRGKYTLDCSGNLIVQKRREERMLEGGPLFDCGAHQIDLARFWLGSDIVRHSAHGAWIDGYAAPDHAWLHLDHANGAHTIVEVSYSYHHTTKNKRSEFVYEIIGTEGVIRYQREGRLFFMENAAGLQEFEFHPAKDFAGMYAEWSRALTTGHSELLASAEDGRRVVGISREAVNTMIQEHHGLPSSCQCGRVRI
jgi:predicted dehydrogenase